MKVQIQAELVCNYRGRFFFRLHYQRLFVPILLERDGDALNDHSKIAVHFVFPVGFPGKVSGHRTKVFQQWCKFFDHFLLDLLNLLNLLRLALFL